MKKIFTFAAVAMALMVVMPASAHKLKFGLKGGLNVTNMSFNEDVVDASNRAGFFIGPTVKLTLPIVGLSFDAAALYDQKEAKINGDEYDDGKTLTQKSFQIPVNVRYGVGLSKVVNVFGNRTFGGAANAQNQGCRRNKQKGFFHGSSPY